MVFALVGIGAPLLGRGVFAGTDEMMQHSPYYDAGYAGIPAQNIFVDDTYDAELPSEILFGRSTRDGSPDLWNPYISGGTPLGAIPNNGLLSPLAVPFYVLPAWLAPAYEKLLETAVAIGGCFLFLRRLRVRRPAALLGGIVFASSAFLVVWTNWPQTRVAAFIPWVFWALERLIQRRRPTDGVLLAGAVAAMVLGGFPAVTAFTLMTAGGYALTRILAEYPHLRRRIVGLVVGAGVAVAGGLALASVQLLPFRAFYSSWLIEGRSQQPAQHLSLTDLATSFAPWTFGVVGLGTGEPTWVHDANIVEASSYVGAAALVLIVVALACFGAGRRLLPRAAFVAVVAAAGTWLALIYVGGPLGLLQHLPVFSDNFVGRARSILGFLLAVLAAVGFDLVLRPRERTAPARPKLGSLAVVAAAVLAGLTIILLARHSAGQADTTAPVGPGLPSRLSFADGQLLLGIGLVAAAAVAVGVLLWLRRRRYGWSGPVRFGAVTLLFALIVGQGLAFVGPYWPRADRSTFYPTTDTQQYLAAHLGHERYAGTGQAMSMGVDVPQQLRALSGHAFINANLAALIRAVPDDPISYASHILFAPDPAVATSPVLDRLATRYFVTSPRDGVIGPQHPPDASSSLVTIAPGGTLTAPVPIPGPLRAVGILPRTGGLPADDPDAWVAVSVTDPHGTVVATGKRLTTGMIAGQPFYIPLAGEAIPAGTPLTAAITLHTQVPLAVAGAAGGRMALGSVSPTDDGLRLVYAGSAVVYQRLHALPRIRWASDAVVQPDQQQRIDLLASGSLKSDQVVLNGPGPVAAGKPATISITTDGADRIDTTVDAQGSGYLVVADALQVGWSVTVDGRAATLVAADQGVVAVAVGPGQHRVELRYDPPYHGLGTWLSALALLTAVALLTVDQRLARRRAGLRGAPPRAAAPYIGGPSRP